jgi:hypothetical protein
VTHPCGHPLGSVPATIWLSDWERRTAVAGPPEVDEVPDDSDDPDYDAPQEDR